MKILKSPQKALILFLTILVVLSFIMILRLEGKTALLQSRLDEHHKSLEKNKDILENLDSFTRKIKSNGISIDGNKVVINASKSSITLENNNIDISSDGKIAIGTPTKSIIQIEKNGDVFIGPNNQKNLGYNKSEDFIYMFYNGARIILGIQEFTSGKKTPGMRLVSKSGSDAPQIYIVEDGILLSANGKKGKNRIQINPKTDHVKIINDESEITLKDKNIEIEGKGDIKIGPSDEKNFGYNKSEDYIYMLNKDSRVVVGPLLDQAGKFKSNGIMLISKTDGPQLYLSDKMVSLAIPGKDLKLQINDDKGMIGMQQGNSTIKLVKNKLEIEIDGDININSKNGNVNINGKKVRLNE